MSQPGKKVTMSDIASTLGISKNSVSLALNSKTGVSNDLRRRIIDTARSMNYGVFSAQGGSRSKCILVIVPEYLFNDVFFYAEVFWAIENEAKSMGFLSVSAGITKEMENGMILPAMPTEMDILGLLVIGVLQKEYIIKLKQTGLPMLSVDIAYSGLDVGWVGSANLSGGYLATKHLINQGHRRLGFIGSIFFAESIYERYCGFMRVMMAYGLTITPDFNILGARENPVLFDTVPALEPYFANIKELPDAWFCAGDRIAVALINILTQKGMRVPGDVSVIGFDDIPMSQLVLPTLTTMRIDRKLMGKLALDAVINSRQDYRQNISITVDMVERDSVREMH